jgi:hypothetical protein
VCGFKQKHATFLEYIEVINGCPPRCRHNPASSSNIINNQ